MFTPQWRYKGQFGRVVPSKIHRIESKRATEILHVLLKHYWECIQNLKSEILSAYLKKNSNFDRAWTTAIKWGSKKLQNFLSDLTPKVPENSVAAHVRKKLLLPWQPGKKVWLPSTNLAITLHLNAPDPQHRPLSGAPTHAQILITFGKWP